MRMLSRLIVFTTFLGVVFSAGAEDNVNHIAVSNLIQTDDLSSEIHSSKSNQVDYTRVVTPPKANERLKPPGKELRCHCTNCEPKVCITDGYCYSRITVDLTSGFEDIYDGCFDRSILVPKPRPLICINPMKVNRHKYVHCCDSSYCNFNISMPHKIEISGVAHTEQYIWILIGSIIVVICAVAIVTVIFTVGPCKNKIGKWNCSRFIGKKVTGPGSPQEQQRLSHELGNAEGMGDVDSSNVPFLNELVELTSSGSGSGLPLLVQRSIARQIQLLGVVGKGRFGEVWKGKWRGEHVAVKIFSSRDESSWFREVEIYQTVMLRHANILGFIAADNKDNGTWTQLWLVADFHPYGSLFDYLLRYSLDPVTLIRMTYTIATGLAHLHMDIMGGNEGKPAIAHRDLKSKNILVKSNMTCAIADLGLAVRYYTENDTLDIAPNTRVGTKRYLAPELLEDTINMGQFESFKRADVYAYGLVLWEMCRRTVLPNRAGADEFQLPYYDMVPGDPSIDDMKRVVVSERRRPTFNPLWAEVKELQGVSSVMKECFYHNPSSRLTALRIKKSLYNISPEVLSDHPKHPYSCDSSDEKFSMNM